MGFTPESAVDLGEINIAIGSTKLGWCTFGITLQKGESFTNNCTALIVASGWWENTGQVWKDANKDSVGRQWGGPPVLAEVIPFALSLPVGTNMVRAWALDARGQRKNSVPVSGDSTRSTLNVRTNAAALWYEVEVAR